MRTILFSLATLCLAAGLSSAQTQLVTDNFSGGTNDAPLSANWTGCGYSGGSMSKLMYESGTAGGGGYSSVACAAYTGYGAFPSNQYVTATVAAPSPSTIAEASIQVRQNATASTQNSFIACGWNAHDFLSPVDAHYRIWSTSASGTLASLALTTVAPQTGDVVGCQVLGVTVTMKVNGTAIASVTDTSGVTSGYPGLYYIDPNPGTPPATDKMWSSFAAGSGAALVSVVITPSSATITAGSFQQFSGTATYSDGTTAAVSTWSSSNTALATIDPTGLAYGGAAGSVTITGATGLDTGTATLTINAATTFTPLVSDGFYGTTDTYFGSNWTGCGFAGGAYSKLQYQNHDAGGGGFSAQECAAYTGNGAFPNDQYATAKLVAPNPTQSSQAAVVVHQSVTASTAESYIGCGWNAQDFQIGNDRHYRIWALGPNTVSAGGPITLYLSTVTPHSGDVLWCQVLGTTVTMKVNGTVIATVQDTSGATSGYPGLYYIDPNPGAPPSSDIVFSDFVAGAGPALVSLAVSPGSASVAQGSYFQLTGTATYADGTTTTSGISWSTSNAGVATVDSTGLVFGVASGTATATATLGSSTGTSTLTVAVGQASPSTGYTLITSDPYLNKGSATSQTYTAPGADSPDVLVPLASNHSTILWLMDENAWAVTSGSGTITTNYPGSGSIAINASLSGLPGGGVDGSPFVLLGCDQFGGCQSNGQPLQFPKQMATMSSLMVDYTYTLAGSISGNRDIDMIWDEWVCPSSAGGGITGPGSCLEVEVLPYFSFYFGGSGNFVRTFSPTVTLDGITTALSFDEYNASSTGPDGQQDIIFYPHTLPGLAAASIRFDMLAFLKQAITDFGNPAYQWLMGMEAGTEFGANAAQSYSLTFTKLDFEQTLAVGGIGVTLTGKFVLSGSTGVK